MRKRPQRNPHFRCGTVARDPRVDLSEDLSKLRVRLADGQPVQIHRTHLFDHDIALGGDLLSEAPLVLPPDVDDDLVARTQTVVRRRRLVLVRLEGQRAAPEHVAPEDLARVRTIRRGSVAAELTMSRLPAVSRSEEDWTRSRC